MSINLAPASERLDPAISNAQATPEAEALEQAHAAQENMDTAILLESAADEVEAAIAAIEAIDPDKTVSREAVAEYLENTEVQLESQLKQSLRISGLERTNLARRALGRLLPRAAANKSIEVPLLTTGNEPATLQMRLRAVKYVAAKLSDQMNPSDETPAEIVNMLRIRADSFKEGATMLADDVHEDLAKPDHHRHFGRAA